MLGLMVILWVAFTIFAYKAIKQPLVAEEKVIENKIEEKVLFDYAAIVQPSTLYPRGGKVVPDKVIFTKLTDKLIIQLDSIINTEKPVKIEGSTGVVFSLVAKDMWEREFELVANHSINTEGIHNSILQKEIELDIEDILSFTNKVEEESLVRSSNYLLVIKPKVEGTIFNEKGNKLLEINSNIEIPFEVSGQFIKYAGESMEREFIKTEVIENINTVPQRFYLFGKELSIIKSRYFFSTISIILLVLILISIAEKVIFKEEKTNEIYSIDKKHKSKIISLSNKTNFGNSPQLGLKSFKALLQISEEKEEPILRYADENEGAVYYYIIGNPTIYYYRSINSIVVKGSCLAHDA